LLAVRCCISCGFIGSLILLALGEVGIFPEPVEHIAEWGMWVFLLLWYYTFRFDIASFYIATVKEIVPRCQSAPLQGLVV